MKEIKISREDLVKRLRKDPRLKEEYVENLELPLAFATGEQISEELHSREERLYS